MALSREQLKTNKPQCPKEELHFEEELGGSLWVRGLTAFEGERLADYAKNGKNAGNTAKLLMLCVINEDGSPFFENDDKDVIESLPNIVAQRIIETVTRLSNPEKEADPKNL